MKPKFNKAKFLEERNQPIRPDVYATPEDIKRYNEILYHIRQMKNLSRSEK